MAGNGADRSKVPRRAKAADFKPRPVTASYLRNAAMHYLSGRTASVSMLRQTLTRRAKRRLAVNALESGTQELIERAIAELAGLGMINDKRFAENRAASLQRKGLSKKRIGLGLKLKGIDAATAASVLSGDVDDLTQARVFAERKKLGPWRRGGADPDRRTKDLQALMRAGFSYSIAVKALAGVGR